MKAKVNILAHHTSHGPSRTLRWSTLVRAINLTPRPMTMVFGLGTRLRLHMRTKVEKMASQSTSRSSSVL